jgi:hypothetical protein
MLVPEEVYFDMAHFPRRHGWQTGRLSIQTYTVQYRVGTDEFLIAAGDVRG